MLLREPRVEPPDAARGIFGLIEELLGKTTRLLDQKLTLLRLEVEESVGTLLRHLALWIGDLLGSAPAGFAIVGGALLLVGVVVIAVRLKRGVGPRRLVPERTVKELEKDTRWIKSAL